MRLDQRGIDFLKQREGFSATKYWDYAGYSIGYGHLIKSGENISEPISVAYATQLLANDVAWAEGAVNRNVAVALSQNQFNALVSLAYNIGAKGFASSTLLRLLNKGDYSGAANQFSVWNKVTANGKKQVNNGLVARREKERSLFLYG